MNLKLPDWRWILKYRILNGDHTEESEDERRVGHFLSGTSGNLFVDIGSHKGYFSKIAKHRYNKIVSIDPDPRWKYNHPLRLMVTNYRGRVKVFTNAENGLMTMTKNFHIHGSETPTYPSGYADTITFDDLRLDADMVKIDAEGQEVEIIEGMNRYLPKRMIVEVHDERRMEEMANKLAERGYELQNLTGYHYLATRLS